MSNSNSDLDIEAYNELIEESKTTGKTIQQILKERHQAEGDVIYSDKTPEEKSKEVREFLAKNTWKQPKTEQTNE